MPCALGIALGNGRPQSQSRLRRDIPNPNRSWRLGGVESGSSLETCAEAAHLPCWAISSAAFSGANSLFLEGHES